MVVLYIIWTAVFVLLAFSACNLSATRHWNKSAAAYRRGDRVEGDREKRRGNRSAPWIGR